MKIRIVLVLVAMLAVVACKEKGRPDPNIRMVVSHEPSAAPESGGGGEEPGAESTVARRVLVVDDHPDNADSLSVLLQLMGHEVSTAYDGEGALRLAESFRPEVVLIDIAMPKLSGHDVGRRIREREWGKDVLLIAVSGWGQTRDRNTSREAGFDHHLVKPADPAVLRELLGAKPAAR